MIIAFQQSCSSANKHSKHEAFRLACQNGALLRISVWFMHVRDALWNFSSIVARPSVASNHETFVFLPLRAFVGAANVKCYSKQLKHYLRLRSEPREMPLVIIIEEKPRKRRTYATEQQHFRQAARLLLKKISQSFWFTTRNFLLRHNFHSSGTQSAPAEPFSTQTWKFLASGWINIFIRMRDGPREMKSCARLIKAPMPMIRLVRRRWHNTGASLRHRKLAPN